MAAGPNAWWTGAEEEILTAELCRKNGRKFHAYEHAGTAIEFALKAIFMKRKNHATIPEFVKAARWHDLKNIAEEAAVVHDLKKSNPEVVVNWNVVKNWQSNARFPGSSRRTSDLDDVYEAVCQKNVGVMEWLKQIFQAA